MKKNAGYHAVEAEAENLVEDAQALLSATANIAEEKVMEARRRLTAAIERGKEAWEDVQDRAVAGARATDRAIREYPYRALGIALGTGLVIGYLLNRRNGR